MGIFRRGNSRPETETEFGSNLTVETYQAVLAGNRELARSHLQEEIELFADEPLTQAKLHLFGAELIYGGGYGQLDYEAAFEEIGKAMLVLDSLNGHPGVEEVRRFADEIRSKIKRQKIARDIPLGDTLSYGVEPEALEDTIVARTSGEDAFPKNGWPLIDHLNGGTRILEETPTMITPGGWDAKPELPPEVGS